MANKFNFTQIVQNIWRSRRFRTFTSLAAILLVILILGKLIYNQRDVLVHFSWNIRPVLLVWSFIAYSIDLFLVAWIWGNILNSMGRKLPVRKNISYFIIANIAKRLPGTVWYIAGRSQFYNSEGIPLRITTTASGIEFMVALLTSILVSIIFTVNLILEVNQFAIIILIIIFSFGILLFHPKPFNWILKRFKIDNQTLSVRSVFFWLICYMLAWILSGLVIYLIGSALTTLPWSTLPYIIGCVALLNVITSATFFAPTNMGLTEIGLSLLLSKILPMSVAIIVTLMSRILITAYEIVWAAIFAFWISGYPKTSSTIKPQNKD